MAKFTLEDLKDGELGDVDRITIMELGQKANRVYGKCTDGTATMKFSFFDIDWLKEGDIVNVKSAYYKAEFNSLQIKKGGEVVKAIKPASKATLNKEEMDALVEDYDFKMLKVPDKKFEDALTQKGNKEEATNRPCLIPTNLNGICVPAWYAEVHEFEKRRHDEMISAIGLLIKAINELARETLGLKQVYQKLLPEVGMKVDAVEKRLDKAKDEEKQIEGLNKAVAKNEVGKK